MHHRGPDHDHPPHSPQDPAAPSGGAPVAVGPGPAPDPQGRGPEALSPDGVARVAGRIVDVLRGARRDRASKIDAVADVLDAAIAAGMFGGDDHVGALESRLARLDEERAALAEEIEVARAERERAAMQFQITPAKET